MNVFLLQCKLAFSTVSKYAQCGTNNQKDTKAHRYYLHSNWKLNHLKFKKNNILEISKFLVFFLSFSCDALMRWQRVPESHLGAVSLKDLSPDVPYNPMSKEHWDEWYYGQWPALPGPKLGLWCPRQGTKMCPPPHFLLDIILCSKH